MIETTTVTPPAFDVVTSSRVKTWYMVQFKGYEVIERREVPKVTRQGRLTYDCIWQLRAHHRQTKEHHQLEGRPW